MAALAGIRREQLLGAIAFGLLVSAVNAASFALPLISFSSGARLSLLAGSLLGDEVRALALLAGIVIADRAVEEGVPRRCAYVAAAVGGCLLGALIAEPLFAAWHAWMMPAQWPDSRAWLHGKAAWVFFPLFDLTHWLLIGGAAVFLYANRRAAYQTQLRLRAAELDRIRHSRRALESRLQAMQARVEPRFLFNTLAQVGRLFERDPARAGRMLDDLIAYLRAAMPRMRDTSSTVGQEVDLARAYLDIVGLRRDGRVAVTIDVSPEARRVRMPPMLLLPLLDHPAAGEAPMAAAGASVHLEAAVVPGGRLRLTLVDRGAQVVSATEGDAVAAIRQRLGVLYGGEAALDLRATAESATVAATVAVLDLPLQPAPAGSARDAPAAPQDAPAPLTSRSRVGATNASGTAMP
jgi:hypothetical protein